MARAFALHLKSAKSLETSYAAIRAGFIALALEKNRRATPFVAEARALKSAALRAKSPLELLSISEIQASLLTASGISAKASSHLTDTDKQEAISGLIKNFLEPAGKRFVEELVFRFLLTRGDALGGSMRNIGGFMAQKKLTRAIIAYLRITNRNCSCSLNGKREWKGLPEDDVDIELSLRGLSWSVPSGPRTLIYNLTLPFLRNNVDLVLINRDSSELSAQVLESADAYVALGELKGGIDPAGADEHWKTARTALERIQVAFEGRGCKPQKFYIGAAIEAKMATEIWDMLQKGILDNAANLTDDEQIASFSEWLCNV